jgi:hypothetical protein
MTQRAARLAVPLILSGLLTGVLSTGCSGTGQAPPLFTDRSATEALFLVHNELFSIRIDGTDRRSIGLVGDNRFRAGWPRRLPDGRAIVLGDETGAIFPYFESNGRMVRITTMNVTLNDSLCGVTVGGASRMVLTTTPFVPTKTSVERLNVDDPSPELMHVEHDALISHPAPYDDGRIVAVRTDWTGTSIVVLDVEAPASADKTAHHLAFVQPPYVAASPARLPDGRVVFLRLDSRDDLDLQAGELWVIDQPGQARATGINGIVNMIVVGDKVIYESAGMNHISDLVASNLVDPPVNFTNTPTVSEHLGWSD